MVRRRYRHERSDQAEQLSSTENRRHYSIRDDKCGRKHEQFESPPGGLPIRLKDIRSEPNCEYCRDSNGQPDDWSNVHARQSLHDVGVGVEKPISDEKYKRANRPCQYRQKADQPSLAADTNGLSLMRS
ncbi:hypothetical protein Poly51_49190 [Rubripirellula tenax]|uniref:Uncharacterized protein n=1 Tax=Rubripirellula tenax TaxID=2528015 RepID=A0A5C6EKK0_9BACT|nr:hypothetical protein Poly51_49190 [Rubripirellula tenax]